MLGADGVIYKDHTRAHWEYYVKNTRRHNVPGEGRLVPAPAPGDQRHLPVWIVLLLLLLFRFGFLTDEMLRGEEMSRHLPTVRMSFLIMDVCVCLLLVAVAYARRCERVSAEAWALEYDR